MSQHMTGAFHSVWHIVSKAHALRGCEPITGAFAPQFSHLQNGNNTEHLRCNGYRCSTAQLTKTVLAAAPVLTASVCAAHHTERLGNR